MTGLWDRVKTGLAALGAILLAVLAGFAAGRRQQPRPAAREVDKQLQRTEDAAKHAGDVLAEEAQKAQDRRKKAEELARRSRGLLPILLLAVALTWAPATRAADAPPPLPGDYDTLARMYLEVVDLAAQYRDLYQQAEASNARLMGELESLRAEVQRLTQVVERQQQLLERQQQSILGLLRGVKVSAGVSLRSLDPFALLPWVGVSYEF